MLPGTCQAPGWGTVLDYPARQVILTPEFALVAAWLPVGAGSMVSGESIEKEDPRGSAPSRGRGQGWRPLEPGPAGAPWAGPGPTPHLPEPLDVSTAQLQVAVSRDHHSAQRPGCRAGRPSAAGCTPARAPLLSDPSPLRLPLTSLFELLLVVVQGLVVVHADPAHLDSQLLWHRLLAAGRGTTWRLARALPKLPVPARHHTTYCPSPQLPWGTVSLLPRGKN